ncbi:hypothetical protein BJ165DRAFT_1474744 [Panaeolus papilionaceus]|nr:hypothetical protein BJ165DRAFT_1474744 [Panaeolus papilionaceus]
MMQNILVWLITGTSSGLGYQLAIEALNRGDKVIATTRASSLDSSAMDELKAHGANILELDVTAPMETLRGVAEEAVGIYGRVDVLVNNAGYLQSGTVEEVTPEEAFNQYNTNVFGVMNVSRAFLPYMRERKTGTIVFAGSVYGYVWSPATAIYGSTKWAIRSISQTMHDEIKHLGLRTTCIDFGFFRTRVLAAGKRAPKVVRIADYQEIAEGVEAQMQKYSGNQPGDPKAGARVVVDIVRGEGVAANRPFPTRLSLGSDSYMMSKGVLEETLKGLEEWKDVSFSTDFETK